MAICIYCAQAEDPLSRKNEADYEGECKACWDDGVWALFQDEHENECVCCVCAYFAEMEYKKVEPDPEGLLQWLPHHVLRNFMHRVEYILNLRPRLVENTHPDQRDIFHDES